MTDANDCRFFRLESPPSRDSTVAARLRAGGAVILGKTNLSEWANFRSFFSTSGWSAVGGQTNNPYGINRNPCGSSSGSGAAATANFAALSFGTETDGSIVCPANANGVVGIKPTVGLTSRAGVVPISHTQDTVGPHARTVADAAVALSVIQSRTADGRDPATGDVPLGWKGRARPTNIPADYTKFLDANGLRGARLGVTRQGIDDAPAQVIAAFEETTRRHAAMPARHWSIWTRPDSPLPPRTASSWCCASTSAMTCATTLRRARAYHSPAATISDAIAFDNAHAGAEMPFFAQEIFDLTAAMAPGPDDAQPDFGNMTYNQALEIDRLSGVNGIDKALADFKLDAVIAPTDNPAWPTDLVRRSLHLRQFGAGRRRWVSHRAGAGKHGVRHPHGHQLLRHGVQRADADQAGVRLRGGDAGAQAQRADLPPHSAVRSHRWHNLEGAEEPDRASGIEPGPAAGTASAVDS